MDFPPRNDDQVEGIAALAEPARRDLYRYVVGNPTPLSREQAASGIDVPVHVAKFHLDKLVDAGLLDVEFKRINDRPGRGGGRPSKLYRRSQNEFSVSVPERHYDLLGRILANAAVESSLGGLPVTETAARIARAEGQEHGAQVAGRAAGGRSANKELEQLAGALAVGGYEPRINESKLLLENCPFHRVAQEQTEFICGLNLEYVTGVADGLRCDRVSTSLEPRAGHCCVSAVPS